MLWPVFEFRPLPDFFKAGARRYAEGKWIEDDGEYDVCFIGNVGWENYSLYVSLPYQKNIVCSWLSGHWTGSVAEHPRQNPWHYALRDGETEWGGGWERDRHPNSLAGRRGMDEVCGQIRCANGRHVEMHANDKHIAAGLLRNRETKETFRFPQGLKCMYCEQDAPIACSHIHENRGHNDQ
jgi:hypothetical protein